MSLTSTVSDALGAIGAGDAAITAMGPGLTIVCALIGGFAVGQLVKWPLSLILKGDAHGYVVRICSVYATFALAHWLSNHLSVPFEVFIAVLQPILWFLIKLGVDKYATWLSPLFASVGDKP